MLSASALQQSAFVALNMVASNIIHKLSKPGMVSFFVILFRLTPDDKVLYVTGRHAVKEL